MSELLGTKVLLTMDSSEGAELAVRAAVDVAESTGSALHMVYVEPLADFIKNGDGAPGYDHQLCNMIEAEVQGSTTCEAGALPGPGTGEPRSGAAVNRAEGG